MTTYNVYCDESCHLENDQEKSMVLGALWCPESMAGEFNRDVAEIKNKHELSRYFEIKWNKVSPGKFNFYKDLINYYFDNRNIFFRAWVIPDKSILSHSDFLQTHDDWYYKMYFYLLRNIIVEEHRYRIYLDIKDSRSRHKLEKLKEILSNAQYDFTRTIIERMQHVRSHDIALLQLADLLIGAISYHARKIQTSRAKTKLIELIKCRSGFSLERNTLPTQRKFNLCIWKPNVGNFNNA